MGYDVRSAKDIVRARSQGLCEKCGVFLTPNVEGIPREDTARSVHHRRPKRDRGRDSVTCMVNLCWLCHRVIHEDEEAAAVLGYIVLGTDPCRVPFLSWRGWVLPQADGSLTLLDFASGDGRSRVEAPVMRERPRKGCRPRADRSRKMGRTA